MSSSTEVVPWGEQFVSRQESRQERRRRRERRRLIVGVAVAGSFVFGSTLLAVVWSNRPPSEAAAVEIAAPTTLPAAPEWTAPPPPTTEIIPESVPTSIARQHTMIKVVITGWDGLGQLLTDGVDYPRVLPGELGIAVIGIDANPATAATIVVEGREWRVEWRDTVAPDDFTKIGGGHPTVPLVVLVSMQPGNARDYVRAR